MVKCFTKKEAALYKTEEMSTNDKISLVNELNKKATDTKRQSKLQAVRYNHVLEKIKSHPKGFDQGLKAYLATDRSELSRALSLEGKMRGIQARYSSQVYTMMEEFMPTKLGFDLHRKAQSDFMDVLINNENIDPKYQKMANEWLKTKEDLRIRFNKAGGNIKKLKDWHMPTDHDAYLILKGGANRTRGMTDADKYQKWYNLMLETVDLEKMGMKTDEFAKSAKSAYKNITSDGVLEFEMKTHGTGKLANKHQQSRFFKFKDADAYKKYHAEYSSATPYNIMMDYINDMTSEIALMEGLGPNPDLTIKSLAKDSGFITSENIYANLSGKTSAKNLTVAQSADTIRNITTGIKLAGATITAVADIPLHMITNHYNGLPAMSSIIKTIGGLNQTAEDRALAAKLWVPLDHMIDSAHSAARYSEVTGHKGSKRFASGILKMSLLDAWTYVQKDSFHKVFLQTMADNINQPHMQRTFRRYGITAEEVKIINASKKMEDRGVEFVDPNALPEDLAERITGMIISETKYAVTEGESYIRAGMNQGTRKGEAGGETLRFAGQFKTFPASVIGNHWMRMFNGSEGDIGSKAAYFANFVV
ncbi:MAG: hypothetical protein DRI24_20655, partial [Deltaproteobacteria bacterium]